MPIKVVTASLPAFDCHLIKEDLLRDRALEIIDNYNKRNNIESALSLLRLLKRFVPEAEDAVNDWIKDVNENDFWNRVLRDLGNYSYLAGITAISSLVEIEDNPHFIVRGKVLEEMAYYMDLFYTTLEIAKKKAEYSPRDLTQYDETFEYLNTVFSSLRPHFNGEIKFSLPRMELLKERYPEAPWLNF